MMGEQRVASPAPNLNSGTNPSNYSNNTRPYYTNPTEGANVSGLVRKFPSNFVYSGQFMAAEEDSRGSIAFYKTSTSSDLTYDYSLVISNNNVYPGTSQYFKYHAMSIRCIKVSGN